MAGRTISGRTLSIAITTMALAWSPLAHAEHTDQVTPPGAVATPSASFEAAIGAAKAAMMANPDEALKQSLNAVAIASASPEGADKDIQLATAHWLQAEALIRLNHPREAEPIIAQALEVIGRVQPGSKLNGDLLMTRASLAGVTGEVRVALQTYQEAHNVYQAIGEDRGRAIALQNIGSIYSDAGDNQRVLQYYAQSAAAYPGDPALNISSHNNRGFAYLDLKQFAEAEDEFRQALALASEQHSGILEVRIMTNIALAQLGAKKLDEADNTAMAALAATKGSAEGWEPFLWGVQAKVAFARHDLSAAGTYIGRTFAASDVDTTTMPFREFHEAAYEIYKALGNTTAALAHMEAYKRLDDEARNVAATTNSALAAAQFDFANQDLRITKLKAGQLERDMELAAWNSRFLYSLLTAAAALLGVSLVGLLWVRRSRNEARAANAKLSIANIDLEKALQARTRFLAMTSHEMRTPLNGILGMTQVMMGDNAVGGELRDRVAVVHHAGQAMKALVDDILDVAKIESGHLALEKREFDLKMLLDGVVNLWRSEAADKQVALIADLQHCPALVCGDEQRIRQVVYNLLSNAIKFTQSGEVRLTASGKGAGDEGRLILNVSDTGIGIPSDKLQVIFESFQQVDASVSRRFGGTGLGLAICRSIVEAMDGTIVVDSTPGLGSTFTIDIALPATAEQHHAVGGPSQEGAGQGDLLIVLGNPLTQAVLKGKLAGVFHAIQLLDAWSEDTDVPGGFGQIVLDADAVGGTTDRLTQALQHMRGRNPDARITVLLPEQPSQKMRLSSEDFADQILVRPIAAKDLVAALVTGDERASDRWTRASVV